jgi:hypothetical protein
VTGTWAEGTAAPAAGSLDWPGLEALLPGLSQRGGEIERLGELPPDVRHRLLPGGRDHRPGG